MQAEYTAAFPKTPAELLKAIDALKLEYKTEAKFVYSELGSIVLGQLVSKLKNSTLDQSLFQILTFAGMRDTSYNPSATPALKWKIAPSGYNGGISQGTPFNKIAHFVGNVAGNAGLFSTVDNLIVYMQLLLNKGKMPNSLRTFSEEVIDRFLNVSTYK